MKFTTVPGAEQLRKLLSVGPQGYLFSNTQNTEAQVSIPPRTNNEKNNQQSTKQQLNNIRTIIFYRASGLEI